MKLQVKELLYGALLTGFALLIPMAFRGWLQVYIPPFSATLGSHVPTMLAMFISPWVAALVGIGSTFGFLITLGPVIAARASVHILIGVAGALLFRRGFRPWQVLALVLPIHMVGEAIAVMPFGFDLYSALVVVGIGTGLHHIADSAITLALYGSLQKAGIRIDEAVPHGSGHQASAVQ